MAILKTNKHLGFYNSDSVIDLMSFPTDITMLFGWQSVGLVAIVSCSDSARREKRQYTWGGGNTHSGVNNSFQVSEKLLVSATFQVNEPLEISEVFQVRDVTLSEYSTQNAVARVSVSRGTAPMCVDFSDVASQDIHCVGSSSDTGSDTESTMRMCKNVLPAIASLVLHSYYSFACTAIAPLVLHSYCSLYKEQLTSVFAVEESCVERLMTFCRGIYTSLTKLFLVVICGLVGGLLICLLYTLHLLGANCVPGISCCYSGSGSFYPWLVSTTWVMSTERGKHRHKVKHRHKERHKERHKGRGRNWDMVSQKGWDRDGGRNGDMVSQKGRDRDGGRNRDMVSQKGRDRARGGIKRRSGSRTCSFWLMLSLLTNVMDTAAAQGTGL